MMTTLGARISADDLTKQSEGLKQLKGVHFMEEAAVDWGLWGGPEMDVQTRPSFVVA